MNFVTRSWLDYGFQCQEIYRRTREKIPVFPIDWVVTENIANLKHIRLDQETKHKLREALARILKEERRARANLERVIRPEPLGEAAEDAHQCFYCTDFAYLSVVHCRNHKINYCIYHEIRCGCPASEVQLLYRHSNDKLTHFETSIMEECAPRIKKKTFTSQYDMTKSCISNT